MSFFFSAGRLSTNSVDIRRAFLMASRYCSVVLLLVQVGKLKQFNFSLLLFIISYSPFNIYSLCFSFLVDDAKYELSIKRKTKKSP